MNDFLNQEEVKRFFKGATFAVFILALFLAVETLGAFKDWQTPAQPTDTISVSGEGQDTAVPDIAEFSFSVSADAASVSDAQASVTAKTNTILNALKTLNIASADIQTSDYSISPKYTYVSSNQIPDGYTVSNTVTVKVRKIDNAGQALAAVGQNGATNVSGLSLTLDNPNAPQAEAQAKAIADAKSKAQVLAKDLGVSLGQVVSFSDDSATPSPRPIYMAAALDSAAPTSAPIIATGQNTVTDDVTITYEIQ